MSDLATIERAVAAAHPPTLAMALIHLTGDAGVLDGPQPSYAPFDDRQGNFDAATLADLRRRATAAIAAHLAGEALPPPPDDVTLRRMMAFVAGVELDDQYVPFLMDEMRVGERGASEWNQPAMAVAARDMMVVVIGAGMSGLLAAIRLKEAGIPFVVVEKNPDVGGAWFENSYPGCRVDSSSHLYAYSFAADHRWPNWYSSQPVMLDYFRQVADRFGVRDAIRFETRVESAIYDDRTARWNVTTRDAAGREATIEASAVISAVGQLNQPKLPAITGRDSFAGPAFHSARWRHDVDLTGKRVAVIGTGASALQFVPRVAEGAGELLLFQRTPPWTLPTPVYHQPVDDGSQWLLDHVPFYAKWYRFFLFWMATDGFLPAVQADDDWAGGPQAVGRENQAVREAMVAGMRAALGDTHPLLDKVVPDYPFGGKRALRDDGQWLRTLQRDNVRLVSDPIRAINPDGLETADGTRHPADVIIYGTGFEASTFLKTLHVTGAGGIGLHESWQGDARAYLGTTMPGFPNFFMLYGPNTNVVVNGSIIMMSECGMNHIMACLALAGRTGADAVEVRAETFTAFNARIDTANRKMAWGAPSVSSWYKNESGRVSQNWPFAVVDYWRETRETGEDAYRLVRAGAGG